MESRPKSRSGQVVTEVRPDSVAAEMGIRPGDRLLAINGEPVKDVFAYRLLILDDEFVMTIERAGGDIWELDIEKSDDEDMGLEFEEALMDTCLNCHNKCLFCFIDQLPAGLRDTLYFKDDDMRLSFLTGNYVTLTNISDRELERMISYHLSPMNVSVHTTNPELRKRMLNNRFAGKIMEQLRKITEGGIELNVQIVLCPGINNGDELERTLRDLSALGETLQSIAVVPVGLTRYRKENHLAELEAFNQVTASQVVDQIERWQAHFLETRGRRIFFAADEFYVRSGRPIPAQEEYEGFPQLENGVGMLSLFREEMEDGLLRPPARQAKSGKPVKRVHVITGTDAGPYLRRYLPRLQERYSFEIQLHEVVNDFFGGKVSVTGLLTAHDILRVWPEILDGRERPLPDTSRSWHPPAPDGDLLLIPDCMLRDGEEIFLDNETPDSMAGKLGIPIKIAQADAPGFLESLDRLEEGDL